MLVQFKEYQHKFIMTQSITPSSAAKEQAESSPPSGDNYSEATE